MGIHELVVGLNGHGKTLYTVAQKLRPLVGTKVRNELPSGVVEVPVRLVVGGVRELLLPHELMEIPEIDPETWRDEWGGIERLPGKPAVRFVRRGSGDRWEACEETDDGAEPVVCSVVNWWLWCEPGDVIVPDECQRVFRPMASGRRVPRFIARLETARHYGVRFVYITQHPQLLHSNVRALVGPIEDVSRVFGGSRTLVRQWDRIGDYGKRALATSRFWKHDKSAFGLYRSAELHTKFGQRLPVAFYAVFLALAALGSVAWIVKGRLAERFAPPSAAASAPAGSSIVKGAPGGPGGAVSVKFPMYEAEPFRVGREPYAGRAIQLEGSYTVGSVSHTVFGIVIDGTRVTTATLAQLSRMGYAYTEFGPCSGSLRFGQVERLVTCQKAQQSQADRPRSAEVSASSPAA